MTHFTEYSVYPGGHIPLPEVEALLDELRLSNKTSPTRRPVKKRQEKIVVK